MAKVAHQIISTEIANQYKNTLAPTDRFVYSSIKRKNLFTSRKKKSDLKLRSALVSLAPDWQALTDLEREAWTSAGAVSGMNGFKQFVQDTVQRRRFGGTGFATPSNLHQSLCGKIIVSAPALTIKIEQPHPLLYYRKKKIRGTRSQYIPIAITENFSLPLTISINAKSNFVSAGASPRVRFYAVVYSNYQGNTIETILTCDIPLVSDWAHYTDTITGVIGSVRGYSVFIEVYNARGELLFDNISIVHTGQDWARDKNCNNINEAFTATFQQCAKHWVAVDLPAGADFHSIYPL